VPEEGPDPAHFLSGNKPLEFFAGLARAKTFGGKKVGREETIRIADRDYRIPSACGLAEIMNREGKDFSGEVTVRAMASMHERSNGLGGGFAGYEIYPDHKEDYAFHLLYETPEARKQTEPSNV
jgi:hypothetical protein